MNNAEGKTGCEQHGRPGARTFLSARPWRGPWADRNVRAPRSALHAPTLRHSHTGPLDAFTLLELLVVISIIALLAAIAMPVLNVFKPNYAASATRQLLDDLARARQLAISQRTTVLMVFVPPGLPNPPPAGFRAGLWNDPAFNGNGNWTPADLTRATNVFERQFTGYAMVSLRSMGDQPGRASQRYLTGWKSLPQGAFIPQAKYALESQSFVIPTNDAAGNPFPAFRVSGFKWTWRVPFPTVTTPTYKPAQLYIWLPYIAFDYLGRLTDDQGSVTQTNAFIPLAKGDLAFSRNPVSKVAQAALPVINEVPAGNATNATSFNLVAVDWLTGRAHVEHQETQ